MARVVITAVVIEGRSKSEVARDYGVSWVWVQRLVKGHEPSTPPCELPAQMPWAFLSIRPRLASV